MTASLMRVFESTIQNAFVMTEDMESPDLLLAFKVTARLQERIVEVMNRLTIAVQTANSLHAVRSQADCGRSGGSKAISMIRQPSPLQTQEIFPTTRKKGLSMLEESLQWNASHLLGCSLQSLAVPSPLGEHPKSEASLLQGTSSSLHFGQAPHNDSYLEDCTNNTNATCFPSEMLIQASTMDVSPSCAEIIEQPEIKLESVETCYDEDRECTSANISQMKMTHTQSNNFSARRPRSSFKKDSHNYVKIKPQQTSEINQQNSSPTRMVDGYSLNQLGSSTSDLHQTLMMLVRKKSTSLPPNIPSGGSQTLGLVETANERKKRLARERQRRRRLRLRQMTFLLDSVPADGLLRQMQSSNTSGDFQHLPSTSSDLASSVSMSEQSRPPPLSSSNELGRESQRQGDIVFPQ